MRLTEEILSAGWKASIAGKKSIETPEKANIDRGQDFVRNNRVVRRKLFIAGCSAKTEGDAWLLKLYADGWTIAEIWQRNDKPAPLRYVSQETLRRKLSSCHRDGAKVTDFKMHRRMRRRA